jgi:hypothetical protein
MLSAACGRSASVDVARRPRAVRVERIECIRAC